MTHAETHMMITKYILTSIFPASFYHTVWHIGRHLRYKRAESSDECRSYKLAESRSCGHDAAAKCSTVFHEEIPDGVTDPSI
jgi:hypothetical protein